MKNEPVVTYNHMQEESSSLQNDIGSKEENTAHPISLYMIFTVDILLICGIGFLVLQLIF